MNARLFSDEIRERERRRRRKDLLWSVASFVLHVAVFAAIVMMFTTVSAMNLMHKAALETGKAPVFAECFESPYLGLSSVFYKVAGDEAKTKALMDEMEALKGYTAQSGAVTVSVNTTAAETNAL